jgi:preprotein translocase subunit YajC
MIHSLVHLLAQVTDPAAPTSPTGAPTGPAPAAPFGNFFFIAIMIALLVFMFTNMRSQKKREERERNEMYSKLSKNDRVLTVGGIIGTVMSVKDNEVVLKVDETTNTKMTFLKSAVQRIITDEPSATAKS